MLLIHIGNQFAYLKLKISSYIKCSNKWIAEKVLVPSKNFRRQLDLWTEDLKTGHAIHTRSGLN